MRLINITQVALPPGRLRSYALRVPSATGQRLPVSFDQQRHVGEGDRPASWMAIAFRLPGSLPVANLARAWLATVERHGTLRTVFSPAPSRPLASGPDMHSRSDRSTTPALAEVTVEEGHWIEHLLPAGCEVREVIRDLFDEACRPFSRPSHRLVLLEPAMGRPYVVIGADHSHVDMWSMLLLIRDLLAGLHDIALGLQPGSSLPPVRAFAEHTAQLSSAAPPPSAVRDRWNQILQANGGAMPVFPLDLGDLSHPRPEVVEVRDVVDAGGLDRLAGHAAEQGVRLLPFAMSVLAAATRKLSGQALRAVFPVHSRHDAQWHDSVGWFITNSVLECEDSDPASCAVSIKEALQLGSYPLAPIFAPLGGMPAGPGMFAISWLDTRRLPVRLDPGLQIQYVSASLRVDGVMIWFIVNEEGLHLRCRYPETPQARTNVGMWLDAIESGLRMSARPSSWGDAHEA